MDDLDLANVMSIKGAISADEAKLLYREAESIRDGCIVEIGSRHGRSTAALAYGSLRAFGVPVYVIEPHENSRGIFGGEFSAKDRVAFLENMLRLGLVETVRLINLSSEHIGSWPDFVGLLWIDGDHRYRAVRRDIDCWLRFLRPDATIIFHDAYNPRIGPFHAIAELVASGQWERHEAVDKAVVLRRKPPL
jgi:hypothetical protein